MKNETIFRQRVDEFLSQLDNCVDFSIQQVAIRGDFDKILCIHGKFVGAEIKDDETRLEPLQAYKAKLVEAAGGIAILIRPRNFSLVKDLLTKMSHGFYDRNLMHEVNKQGA